MSRHHRPHATQLRAARAHFAPLLPLPCARCRRLVWDSDAWDVGHRIPAEAGGDASIANTWPEHRRCNRSAGGRRGAQLTNARRAARRAEAAASTPRPPTESEGLLEW